jgi:hypothetical protein
MSAPPAQHLHATMKRLGLSVGPVRPPTVAGWASQPRKAEFSARGNRSITETPRSDRLSPPSGQQTRYTWDQPELQRLLVPGYFPL